MADANLEGYVHVVTLLNSSTCMAREAIDGMLSALGTPPLTSHSVQNEHG